MNRLTRVITLGIGALVFGWAGLSMAVEESMGRNFQVKNRLRFEYDDNIYQAPTNKQDSFMIAEELELICNINLEQSYIGIRYRPTFVWWSDREPDDMDFHHDFDLDVTHNISPRLALSLKDTFLYAQQPALIERISQDDTYYYNRANADATYQLRPKTKLGLGGRHTMLRYEKNEVGHDEDYDITAGGLTLRQQHSGDTTILGEVRGESVVYSGEDRDSTSIYAGTGVEHTFTPSLQGSLRAGYHNKSFSSDAVDTEHAPYADASVTVLPSPRTRMTFGAGYSLFESDVYPYASQARTLMYVSAAHDLTARISFFLTGSFQNGDYSGDQSVDSDLRSEDGKEDVFQMAARASYKLDRNNWLEAGYQYFKLDSDIRDEFERNRYFVGWRTTL